MRVAPLLFLVLVSSALPQSWLAGSRALPETPEPSGLPSLGQNSLGRQVYRNPQDGARLIAVSEPPGLLVAETEVTVEQFQRFLKVTGVASPPDWSTQVKSPTRPVMGVNWATAREYATWSGGRLPSDADWAAFAAAPLRAQAPVANWNGDRAYRRWQQWDLHLRPSGSDPQDISRDGVRDLGGSLYEWCLDREFPEHMNLPRAPRLLRGGNFLGPTDPQPFFWHDPRHGNRDIGFRVVYTDANSGL